jgi:sugar phosphate isomerase/epimerase
VGHGASLLQRGAVVWAILVNPQAHARVITPSCEGGDSGHQRERPVVIIESMNRRSFLAASIAAAVPVRAAVRNIDSSRVSAITDEISRSPEEAIAFAHKFGMQWLSLRDIPTNEKKKTSYHSLDPAALQQAQKEFREAGIRVSFLDAPLLKFTLPGTSPKRARPEEPAAKATRLAKEQEQFDKRFAELQASIRASHTFDCPNVRIFTFTRVEEPEALFPRLADVIGEMALIAEKEGIKLLIENEASQNAGTSVETAKLLKLLPRNVGVNWDSLNGVPLGEKPFPDGYESLPKDRIWNVHVKGKSLLDYPEHLDWLAILSALERDGFAGRLELETHIFGDGQVPSSHASMREIMRLLNSQNS